MLTFILCAILMSITHATDTKPTIYPHGPLFGGKSIEIEEIPYLVTIHACRVDENNCRQSCSGLLISNTHVLTTAHCVNEAVRLVSLSPWYITMNSSLRNVPVKPNYKMKNYELHPQYHENKHGLPVNDLAVLKFSHESQTNLDSALAVLFDESDAVSAGIDALVTGWARFNNSNEEHLTSRVVQTLDASLCEKAYERVGGLSVGQICAAYPGADGKDGCQGDRGAPIVIGRRVAGILSWGNGCVEARYPGVYTNIAYYREWIDRTMRKP